MNAPAPVQKPREAYYPAVRVHYPGADDEEIECRAAIMVYRDIAQRARSDHWMTGHVAEAIHRTAALAALAPATIDELRSVGRALRHMTRAFGELESVREDG